MRISATILCCGAMLLLLFLSSPATARLLPALAVNGQADNGSNNNEPDDNVIPGQYQDRSFFLTPIKQVRNQPCTEPVTGITVPHHLLARDLIALAFNFASLGKYRRILLFSPNHFTLGSANVSISAKDLSTVFGILSTDTAIVKKLTQLPFVREEDFFYREHGVEAVLPFIKYYFPETPVVVISIKKSTSKKELSELSDELMKLLTPDTLIVQSTDFSHYLTPARAAIFDKQTIAVLKQADAGKIFSLHQPNNLDSIAAQYLQTRLQKEYFHSQFNLIAHKNSQDYTTEKVTSSTSYLVQAYIKKPESSTVSKLIFVGDIMLSRAVADLMQQRGDYQLPFSLISDFLKSGDLTFGNLEGPISARGDMVGRRYSFRASPKVAPALREAGFNILSIANNHIWDYGREAFLDTLALLKDANIDSVGGGINLEQARAGILKEINGNKILLLAYTDLLPKELAAGSKSAGINYLDIEQLRADIKAAKSSADIIIISCHWGREYQKEHSPHQAEIARAAIDAGAALIIGHHPHVVQELEEYQGGWIAYSLGNFIFDQNFSEQTRAGLALVVTVGNHHIIKIEKIPIRISKNYQPYLVETAP